MVKDVIQVMHILEAMYDDRSGALTFRSKSRKMDLLSTVRCSKSADHVRENRGEDYTVPCTEL